MNEALRTQTVDIQLVPRRDPELLLSERGTSLHSTKTVPKDPGSHRRPLVGNLFTENAIRFAHNKPNFPKINFTLFCKGGESEDARQKLVSIRRREALLIRIYEYKKLRVQVDLKINHWKILLYYHEICLE